MVSHRPCQGHGPPRSANLENFLNNYSALTLMTLPAGWLHHSVLCLCWFISSYSHDIKLKRVILDEPHLCIFLLLYYSQEDIDMKNIHVWWFIHRKVSYTSFHGEDATVMREEVVEWGVMLGNA